MATNVLENLWEADGSSMSRISEIHIMVSAALSIRAFKLFEFKMCLNSYNS